MQPPFGQWIGTFDGTANGFATLSVERDRLSNAFACLTQGYEIPGSRIDFVTESDNSGYKATSTSIRAFDRNDMRLLPVDEWQKRNGDDVVFSRIVTVDGSFEGPLFKGKWRGDIGSEGGLNLQNLAHAGPIAADFVFSWSQFRGFVNDLIQQGVERIFRGQANSAFRLKTTFHRQGRYDLLRYVREVTDTLAQHVNAALTSKFNVRDADDFGALLSLAQHHGFPTPLLDWTRSPYIAAFFAMEELPRGDPTADYCRVYALDSAKWRSMTSQTTQLSDPTPAVTVREFPAHNNPRHLPQQSIHTFSNVEDVAAWIRLVEQSVKNRFLTIIDIPRSERRIAMADLAYMGVTAATLFPGLDGICRSLKERYFSPE